MSSINKLFKKLQIRLLENSFKFSSNIYGKRIYRIIEGDKKYVLVGDFRKKSGFIKPYHFNLVAVLEALVFGSVNVFRNFITLGYSALISVDEQTICGSCVVGNYSDNKVYRAGICMGKPECIKIIANELGLELIITSYYPPNTMQCRKIGERYRLINIGRGEEFLFQKVFICYL